MKVKRKHIAQNRDIIKSNAFLQIRIRELEDKIHTLEAERNAVRADNCRLSAASIEAGKRVWLDIGNRLGFLSENMVDLGYSAVPPSSRIELDPEALPGNIVRMVAKVPDEHIGQVQEEPEAEDISRHEDHSPSTSRDLLPPHVTPEPSHDNDTRPLTKKSTAMGPRLSADIAALAHTSPFVADWKQPDSLPKLESMSNLRLEQTLDSPPRSPTSGSYPVPGAETLSTVSAILRSPSPAASEDSEDQPLGSRTSRRSSVRARASINYALPKLNTKMRRPDPEDSITTGASREKTAPVTTRVSASPDHIKPLAKERLGIQAKRQRLPDPTTQKLRPSRSCEGLSAARRSAAGLRAPIHFLSLEDLLTDDINLSEQSRMSESDEVDDRHAAETSSGTPMNRRQAAAMSQDRHNGETLSELFEMQLNPRCSSVLATSDEDEGLHDNGSLDQPKMPALSERAETAVPCRDRVAVLSPHLEASALSSGMEPSHERRSAAGIDASAGPMAVAAAMTSELRDSRRTAPEKDDFSKPQALKRSLSSNSMVAETARLCIPSSKLPSSLAEMASSAAWPSTPRACGGFDRGLGGDRRTSKKVTALNKFGQHQQQRLSKAQTMGTKKIGGVKARGASAVVKPEASVQPKARRSSSELASLQDFENKDPNEHDK